MQIETSELRRKTIQINERLEDYFKEVGEMEAQFIKLSASVTETVNETLNSDESNLLSIMYRERLDDLKVEIATVKNSIKQHQHITSDFSYKVYQNIGDLES